MMRKFLATAALWALLPAAILGLFFALDLGLMAVCFYALFAILISARLMTRFWLDPVEVEREVSDDVVRIGDAVKVIVRIYNRSAWPLLWLYAEESLPAGMPREGTTRRLLFLPPGRSFYLHYRFTPTCRGCHQLGPLVLETGDVFGLFKRCRIEPRRDFITALPRHHVIEEFDPGQRRRLGGLAAARSLFDDPTLLRGTREYQRGDAMKRIHWKSSARRGRLVSKLYDPVSEAGATLVLDLHKSGWTEALAFKNDGTPPELGIELAATIARYLSDGGWKFGLLTNGRDPLGLRGATIAQAKTTESLTEALQAARFGRTDDRLEPVFIPASRAPDQFALIEENLGRVAMTDGLAIEDALLLSLAHIEREQVLVVIAGGAGEGMITGLLRARALGYRIMFFLVCNNAAHDAAFAALAPHGIEVFRTDEPWRMKEIATGRRNF